MSDIDSTLAWAKEQASTLLPPLGDRWLHVQGVVAKAQMLSQFLKDDDGNSLLIAAYLHDIAYAPSLVITGFHPLDGAKYIKPFVSTRVVGLVAHHTQARFEAEARGLLDELDVFPNEKTLLSDALAYCDVLTDSRGNNVSLRQRREGVLSRYGPDHIVSRSFSLAYPYLCLSVARIHRRISIHKFDSGHSAPAPGASMCQCMCGVTPGAAAFARM
jgi:hypothetical protein